MESWGKLNMTWFVNQKWHLKVNILNRKKKSQHAQITVIHLVEGLAATEMGAGECGFALFSCDLTSIVWHPDIAMSLSNFRNNFCGQMMLGWQSFAWSNRKCCMHSVKCQRWWMFQGVSSKNKRLKFCSSNITKIRIKHNLL